MAQKPTLEDVISFVGKLIISKQFSVNFGRKKNVIGM